MLNDDEILDEGTENETVSDEDAYYSQLEPYDDYGQPNDEDIDGYQGTDGPDGGYGESDLDSYKLEKEVFSNQDAQANLNRNFTELIDLGIDIDVRKLFSLYNELFYHIQKRKAPNEQSHYNLIYKSLQYFNNYIDYCSPTGYSQTVDCDNEINRLIEIIENINEQAYEKEIQIEEQNLLYQNGTLLRGEHLSEIGLPVWVMVKGKKREIKTPEVFTVIKRALGHPADTPNSNILKQVTNEELSNIIEGLPIEDITGIIQADRNSEITINDPVVTISETFNYRESTFSCLCGRGDDPEEAIDLNSIFGPGQPSNGTDNPGKCTIIYYDLDSQQQVLVLEPGQSTKTTHPVEQGIIRHRVDLLDGIESVPADFSNPLTPITDNEGNNYNLDDYGNVVNGVYINGFVREIRFTQNGEQLTLPAEGTGYLYDDDGNGNIFAQHTIEAIMDDFPDMNFNIFYYNAPFVGRLKKNSIYYGSYENGHLNGGHTDNQYVTPYIRMFTDGEGGLYEQFPPTTAPDGFGTYGFSHAFTPEVGVQGFSDTYALSNIKTNFPDFYNNVLNNPSSRIYNPWEDVSKCIALGPKYNDNFGFTNGRIFSTENTIKYLNNYNTYGTTSRDIDDDPSTEDIDESANNYSYYDLGASLAKLEAYTLNSPSNTENIWGTNHPLVFNLDIGFYGYSNLGFYDIKPYMIYGAPIFQMSLDDGGKLWYVVGKSLPHISYYGPHRLEYANDYSGYNETEGNWRYGKSYDDHWRLIYPVGYYKYNLEYYGGPGHPSKFLSEAWRGIALRYPERHPVMEATLNSYEQIMLGNAVTSTNLNEPNKKVKCVFPGLDHVFYQNHINTGGQHFGMSTPWNSTDLEAKFSILGHQHY